MTNTKEQVLEMVSAGKISAAEGDQLLGALQAPTRSPWHSLINPFENLGTAQALLLGVVGAAVGLGLSHWNVRFDGAMDLHFAGGSIPLSTAVLDQLVAWPLTGLIFWVVAWLLARQSRAIDFVGSVGVARLPLLASGAVGAALHNRLPSDPSQLGSIAPGVLIALIALTLPGIVWTLTLLFQGFRTASGLRGAKGKVAFALAIVAAEVLSKLVLQLAR